jgi:3-deoxy-manno-octulosonate cytidylyltransferase (CMP-KDO synthetase)
MPPHPLEEVEKLEQLRALAHGMTIGVHQARSLSHGIDTPEDLKWAQQQIAQMGSAAFPSGRIQ